MILEYAGIKSTKDCLYFFYSSYNSNCNILKQMLEGINRKFNNLTIIRVNTTKYPDMKSFYNIRRIPSYILIKNSEIIFTHQGSIDSYSLARIIERNI